MSTEKTEKKPPRTEVWLRGPVPGIPDPLMPAAHSFMEALEEIESAAPSLSFDELWQRPGGAASPGFHLKHIAGATDRLLTYARGETLTPAQLAYLKSEKDPGTPPESAADLVRGVKRQIELALTQLSGTPVGTLADARTVGRAALPTTVLGLLFHAGEHAFRHAGQLTTTIKVVRGSGAA